MKKKAEENKELRDTHASRGLAPSGTPTSGDGLLKAIRNKKEAEKFMKELDLLIAYASYNK